MWSALGGGSRGQQTGAAAAAAGTARGWVQAEGLKAVCRKLLELEGQLPVGAVCNPQCQFWASWRVAVESAATPQQMASQVGVRGGGRARVVESLSLRVACIDKIHKIQL